jgi:hypothetical protein
MEMNIFRAVVIASVAFSLPFLASANFVQPGESSGSDSKLECENTLQVINLSISSPGTVEKLETFDCVIGNIKVQGFLPSVINSRLKKITGSLVVENNPNISQLSFSALEEINGSLVIIENPALTFVEFGRLGSLNGSSELSRNASIRELNLWALGAVNGDFKISGNNSLETIKLNALGGINGRLKVSENPALVLLEFAELQSLNGWLIVTKNSQLNSESLQPLAQRLKKNSKLSRVRIKN